MIILNDWLASDYSTANLLQTRTTSDPNHIKSGAAVLCLLLAEIYSPKRNVELVLVVRPTGKAEDHFERGGCLKQYSNHTPVLPTPGKAN